MIGLIPRKFAIVGKISNVEAISEHITFEGIIPGHRIIQGTRIPPSNTDPFPLRKGKACPPSAPFESHGPLSDVKITRVFFEISSLSKTDRRRPVS